MRNVSLVKAFAGLAAVIAPFAGAIELDVTNAGKEESRSPFVCIWQI